MLDIKFIRENKDLVQEAARKKRLDFNVGDLLTADDKRLSILKEVETFRALQNEANQKVAGALNSEDRNVVIEEMKLVKEQLQKKDKQIEFLTNEENSLKEELEKVRLIHSFKYKLYCFILEFSKTKSFRTICF